MDEDARKEEALRSEAGAPLAQGSVSNSKESAPVNMQKCGRGKASEGSVAEESTSCSFL